MIRVRRLLRHLYSHESDDGRSRIGQVVKCIRSDGDAVQDEPHRELHRKQENVAEDAHETGEHSVRRSHRHLLHVFMIFYKMSYQKFCHYYFPSQKYQLILKSDTAVTLEYSSSVNTFFIFSWFPSGSTTLTASPKLSPG